VDLFPARLTRRIRAGIARSLRRDLRAAPRSPYPEQFSEAMDLPPIAGPPRLYLIATTPRCGSHYLGHAITECRSFGVPLEYLKKQNQAEWHRRFGTTGDLALFRQLLHHRSGPAGWFGLKAHWFQFAPYEGRPLLPSLGGLDRALWVWRRDLLAQAISYVLAEQTGQWISGAPPTGAASYDYATIVEKAERVREGNAAWQAFFSDRFDGPLLPIAYEDLIAAPERILEDVANFLDPTTAARPVPSHRTRKQSGTASATWRQRFLADLRDEDRWILDAQSWGRA
jgi:LPS sulfotransferase NodH